MERIFRIASPATRRSSALQRPALPAQASGRVAVQHLEEHLKLVGAWVKRAIAEGWDSGRLASPSSAAFPFESEVDALIDGVTGRAQDRVQAARTSARAQEVRHSTLMRISTPVPPLAALAQEFGLSALATEILLVVAAPSVWGEMARLYRIAANDKERPICDELLVTTLLGSERASRRAVALELEPHAPLVRHGLISAAQTRRPFGALVVHPVVIRRLYGDTFTTDEAEPAITPREATVSLEDFIVPGGVLEPLRFAISRRPEGGSARVVIRGKRGSGRATLLAALAAQTGRRLAVIELGALLASGGDLRDALRDALTSVTLRGWIPCISGIEHLPSGDARIQDQVRDAVRAYVNPLTFRCPPEVTPPIEPGFIACDLPGLDEAGRADAWRSTLVRHGLSAAPAELMASRYQIGPGIMERAVAGLGDEEESSHDLPTRLDRQLRQFRDDRMGAIATRVTRLATWESVVLPTDVIDGVKEFVGRLRHRRTVYDRWGFDRVMTSTRGLTALFDGRPGTGKSMVAGIIARELGYDLFRVDLSRVMSKWVGETERNLSAVFEAAEEGQVVLLFDEADSLFARRTEVESASDRYANLAVNYLLQRLDSFDGVAVLTTNLAGSIDQAFKRRMSLRMHFPFPDAEMREKLWRVHLPAELPIGAPVDFRSLAIRYKLSGGYIRNAALRAAFLAAEEARPLEQAHVERAVTLEYLEQGKLAVGGVLE
jgi:hypothetical protein